MVKNNMWEVFTDSDLAWDNLIIDKGCRIPYQLSAWANSKSDDGWSAIKLIYKNQDDLSTVRTALQILIKKKFMITIAWIPGGAIGDLDVFDVSFTKKIKSLTHSKLIYCRMNLMREYNSQDIIFLKASLWRKPDYLLNSGKSMSLKTTITLDDLRLNFSGNWRHNLKRSEKKNIVIEKWENPQANDLYEIYLNMQSIKNIGVQFSLQQLQSIIVSFGSKLVIYKCVNSDGCIIAFRGIVIVGSNAFDIFAAANHEARRVYATYGIFWSILDFCVHNRIGNYDLGGIDPVNNMGVYNFKKGTGADAIEYLGEWDYSSVSILRFFANKYLSKRGDF